MTPLGRTGKIRIIIMFKYMKKEIETPVDTSKLDNAILFLQEKLAQFGIDYKGKSIIIKDDKLTIK
jgi:hypothetical protein